LSFPASLEPGTHHPDCSGKRRIVHVIVNLGTGGADMMLYKVLKHAPLEFHNSFSNSVISFMGAGVTAGLLRQIGIKVFPLGLERGTPTFGAGLRLARLLRLLRPDLIQTWLYHSDLVAGLLGAFLTNARIVWNIRQTNLDPSLNSARTLMVVHLCARLSRRLPTRIICNSRSSMNSHEAFGFDNTKFRLIPNGFDLSVFRPNPEAKPRLLRELGIPGNPFLIGCVGRFDPQKDHANLIKAARLVVGAVPEARFLLAGLDVVVENQPLQSLLREADMTDRFVLLGERADIADIIPAFDLAVSPSAGESFANFIGEAMACGVPTIATDVGDSAHILGNCGIVVPPRNPEALGQTIVTVATLPPLARQKMGSNARVRASEKFEINHVAKMYADLYSEILS